MDKRFIAILAAVIVVLGGLVVVAKGEQEPGQDFVYGDPTQLQEFDYVEGEGENVLIEYGDFQCPGCGAFFPLLEQAKADPELQGKFKFAFRHFPLTSIHPQAMAAHRAAEAAGQQGKFYEMHDLLYQRQQEWSGNNDAASIFEAYAEEIGLDMERYRADLKSQTVFNRIDADMDSGQELGVRGTPTLVYNGEVLTEAPRDLEAFKALILGEDASAGAEEAAEDAAAEPAQ